MEHYYCFHGHMFSKFDPKTGEVHRGYPKEARDYFMRCAKFSKLLNAFGGVKNQSVFLVVDRERAGYSTLAFGLFALQARRATIWRGSAAAAFTWMLSPLTTMEIF